MYFVKFEGMTELSIHDLTRRSTERGQPHIFPSHLSIHDLTRRSTMRILKFRVEQQPFNSRPHKEVDLFCGLQSRQQCLSIHDLTRRSTTIVCIHCVSPFFQFTTSQGGRPFNRRISGSHIKLSIHDLTRRSTYHVRRILNIHRPFNSRPHKEVDLYVLQSLYRNKSFNSRPHKEVDVYVI